MQATTWTASSIVARMDAALAAWMADRISHLAYSRHMGYLTDLVTKSGTREQVRAIYAARREWRMRTRRRRLAI